MNRFIGDRNFYRKVLTVTIPIMIQNGVTNFVSMLDNIMVGRIGTDQMSGVAIVNQLIFVFNICIFGALAGAGILGAQYYGKADQEGIRHVFRFKLICALVMVVLGVVILSGFGGQLIRLYLHEGTTGNLEDTYLYGSQYLKVMLFELLPFAVVQMYSSTLRETGETVVPMISSLCAGGKTGITFLFDSGVLWSISIPLLFCLIHFTALTVVPVFILVQSVDIFRSILGIVLLKKGVWARTIVVSA